jgi:rubrerythrin
MRFSTTKDLLDHAASLHQGLGAYYQRLAGDSRQEKVQLLLEYLARHEENLAAELARYSKETAARVRDAWFKFELDGEFIKCVPPAMPAADIDVNELINLAIALDDCIIDLYRLVARESELPEARDAFLNLAAQERQEKMRMVRQAMRLNEM